MSVRQWISSLGELNIWRACRKGILTPNWRSYRAYGLRSEADLISIRPSQCAESAAQEAHRLSHDKASFLDAAIQGLLPRLQVSTHKFQASFLALFSDKDYAKILDSLAKVDKAHKKTAPAPNQQASTQLARPPTRPNRVRCYYCGIPGHMAANCFRRPQRGSYTPYTKPFGRGQNN